MSDFPERLPEKLKAIRERLGMTPDQLAPFVGAKTGAEILAYENDEDDLLVSVLFGYAKLANIPVKFETLGFSEPGPVTVKLDEDVLIELGGVEELLELLDEWLNTLTGPERHLMLKYYADNGIRRIRTRKELSEALGLSSQAIRQRVRRLKIEFKGWIAKRVTN